MLNSITIPNREEKIERLLASRLQKRDIPKTLTEEHYREAVSKLIKLAQLNCGSSRIAAQVLLSTYNGNNWQCNLADLADLDGIHYRAAIIVIRARVELRIEPQRMIMDGDAVFNSLEQDWQDYHVKNRYRLHK